ncbi:MAG: hypothetical protein KUG68_11470 [Flavobacteriaceae bacterium]|nr:hypothetical protein [Flavobacteriaceae bacterium]
MKKIFLSTIVFFLLFASFGCTEKGKSVILFESLLQPTNEPKIFMEGVVSVRNVIHFGSSFSENGKHLVYTNSEGDGPSKVMIQAFEKNQFSTPKPIVNDTLNSYGDASISSNGKVITLTSTRPQSIVTDSIEKNGIWQFFRDNESWANPKFIDLKMDYEGGFGYPTMTDDQTLYFAYIPDDGTRNMDIFRSQYSYGGYEKPEKLPPNINSSKFEGDPYIDPKERFLIFAGFDRDVNYGKSDLYISFKLDDGWSNPINLGKKINSHGYDGSPYVTSDDQYLIFTSSRHPENKDEEELFNVFYVSFDLEMYMTLKD